MYDMATYLLWNVPLNNYRDNHMNVKKEKKIMVDSCENYFYAVGVALLKWFNGS